MLPRVPNVPPPLSSQGKGNSLSSRNSSKVYRREKSLKDERTLSQRFIRAPIFDTSQFVWIEEEEKVWVLCTILKQDNTILRVQDVDTGNVYQIDIGFDELKLYNKGIFTDMSKMKHIHEPAILYNLSRRFLHKHHFYTYIGRNVLVSVNPLSWKYPVAVMEDFFTGGDFSDTPHPFVLAEQAFQGIRLSTRGKVKHQSLVISGESGSGKTEASKLVLQYIAKRVEALANGTKDHFSPSSTSSISNAILQSSPILEAFGNAKTCHNPNSSRFGKYVKIFFDVIPKDVAILGAKHEIYLLEKSRVLGQALGEQNFHIFYQYLSGIFNGSLDGGCIAGLLDMSDADGFRLLNPCDSLDVMFDKFLDTQKALENILAPDAVVEMWNIIGGILQLGNVEFVDNETAEGNVSYISGLTALQSACTLLDVDWKEMRQLMTQKVIETRDERFVVPLTLEGAVSTRDAICKSIYETLFNSIVSLTNNALSNANELKEEHFIGVLDLFGFENVAVNGFNQFMINFANEAMHNCFNDRILQAEVNLYEEESIECILNVDDCPNNTGCLALIASGVAQSKSPSSILLILDSICQQPKGGDAKFCESLHNRLGSNTEFAAHHENIAQHFLHTHPKDQRHLFKVKHYAGVVTYAVQNLRTQGDDNDDELNLNSSWVDLNKDAIPCALETIMKSSGNSLLRNNVSTVVSQSTAVAPNTNNLSRQKLRMKSVATMFSSSIRDLCKLVQSTECYFVRCIKPNRDMSPDEVDNAYMIQQIRSLALVQTSQVKQVGLQMFVTFTNVLSFLSTSLFTPDEYQSLLVHPPSVLVASWLAACGLSEEYYSLGKSKVFFREGFQTKVFKDDPGVGAAVASLACDEGEIIALIAGLHSKQKVINTLLDILLARKQREETCIQYQARMDQFQKQLDGVKAYLQSYQSQPENVPSLVPFSAFFKLADEANSSLDTAHFQADVVTNRVNALAVAMSACTAPVQEAAIIQTEILERVSTNRSKLSMLPSHVTKINTYEQNTRASIMQAQEEFNDIALGYWDNISLIEKSLESVASLVTKLDEGGGDCQALDALAQRIDADLATISTLFVDKLPSPAGGNSWGGGRAVMCDEVMLSLAAEVVAKGKEVVAECDAIKQLCIEAEEELVESKKTLLFFEKATRTILRRIIVNEETSGDDHGMLWSKSESSGVDSKETAPEKSKILTSEHSVSFSDDVQGELDDDKSKSTVDSGRFSMDRVGSRDQGRRLTMKTLRKMQRGLSGMVSEGDGSGEGRDNSALESFSRDSCDFDDDDDDDSDISVIDMDFWIIPNGWEEYFDTDTQTCYYLNTITQSTQWERPDEPAEGTAGSVTWADDILIDTSALEGKNTEGDKESDTVVSETKANSMRKEVKVQEQEKKYETDAPGVFQDKHASEGSSWSRYDTEVRTDVAEGKNTESRVSTSSNTSVDMIKMNVNMTTSTPSPSKCNLNYGRVTTTQLSKLSTQPKEGHLMIQSTSFFSTRWTRKYFVLDGLRLECYEKSEHYFYGLRKPKVMHLSLSTCTSFTDDANTFIVKTTDEKKNAPTWTLAAPNHSEKNEWVTYINAHVYTHHCNQVAHLKPETALDRRLMDASKRSRRKSSSFSTEEEEGKGGEGEEEVTFWQLTPYESRGEGKGEVKQGGSGGVRMLPVGIRTLPAISSSRTGEGIFPGEHVEVVATQQSQGEGLSRLSFLKLADHRGWVFSLNPSTGAVLFVPAVGYTYRAHEGLQFQVASSETNGVRIQYNPGDCSPYTGALLYAGEVVETTASFQLDMDLKHSLFVKLADGRGWVNTQGQDGGIGMRALS